MAERLDAPDLRTTAPGARFQQQANQLERPASRAKTRTPTVGVLPAIQSLLYVLVVALFLMAFTVQPIRIPSASMEPTLLVGDFLLLDKQAVANDLEGVLPPSGIQHGDVIVFHDPVGDPSIHLVKRVIGLPGDRLHLKDGVVYRNGEALTEGYAVRRPVGRDLFRDNFPVQVNVDAGVDPGWWIELRSLIHDGELTVPPNSYFVMGDNRNNSEDSRYWGFVPKEAVVGKPILVYFSWLQADDDAEAPTNGAPMHKVDMLSKMGGFRTSHFARWERTFLVVR